MHNQWILLPIIGAVGYSLSRFLKNYLIDTQFKGKDVAPFAVMTIGSHIITILVLFAVFGQDVFALPLGTSFFLMLAGTAAVISQFPHFKALKIAETVEVTIFSQSSPLIALLFGLIFLHQAIVGRQLLGFALIMIAAGILVFGQKTRSAKKLKIRTAGLVLASSSFWILSDILFLSAVGNSRPSLEVFAKYFFYFQLGAMLSTILIFLLNPRWKRILKNTFFARGKLRNLTASLISNIAYAAAEILYKLALLAAPAVALLVVVDQVAGLIITFILGIFLSLTYPKLGREKLTRDILVRHLVAAVLVGAGIILVS